MIVAGVKLSGIPGTEIPAADTSVPDSPVAYMVTPLAENAASFSVPTCPFSEILVTTLDMLIEPTVNSIIWTVPPPARGRLTLPL